MISCSHFAILIWTVTCRRFALRFIASEHAYFCANPVIVFSSFWWHWTFVFDSWFSGCFVQNCFFLVYHMEILVEPNTRHSLHSLRNWSYSVATTLSSVLTAIQGFACSGSFWLNVRPTDRCLTSCTAFWCHCLCSIPNPAFQAPARDPHYTRLLWLCLL